jgi:hypothetical protein
MHIEATAVRDTKVIRAPMPGRWSAPPSDAAVRAVVRLGMLPMRLLATSTGRRLSVAMVLSVALVGTVSLLYDHADSPTAVVKPLNALNLAATKPASAHAAAKPAAAKPAAAKPAAGAAQESTAAVAARPAKRPEDAAAAWYARRLSISPDRVHALQRTRVSAAVTKVMVVADVSATRMSTAMVTVKRAGDGWKVP